MVAPHGSDQLLLGLPSLRAAPSKRQARAEPQYLARLTTGLGSRRGELRQARGGSRPGIIVPQAGATKLTVQQEEKVKEKVRAIGSEFPVFVKVMTAYDVSKIAHLAFCREYASACRLPLEQTPLLLRLEGSSMRWSSALMVQQNNNVRRICSFWQDIVSQAGTEDSSWNWQAGAAGGSG
ncbi:hypothetical protein VPH35_092147 [Triticum aestivum]